MLSSLQIEALAQGCCRCGQSLEDRDRVRVLYPVSGLQGFERQIALGLIGSDTRNFWAHLNCNDPKVRKSKWHMHPDLRHCIRCGEGLRKRDMVSPIFQVVDPQAVNPDDADDQGISLGDRVYLIHASCHDPEFTTRSPILLRS